MKILVTGASGQLGSSLKTLSLGYPHWDFHFTDVDDLDISDPNQVEEYLSGKEFSYLINCAAYTAVDLAETEQQKARLINATAVKFLAENCEKNRITLIHISTDYVFDGSLCRPYTETDNPDPINFYGLTKLEGEQAARENCSNLIILRSSWLYSEFGKNFLKTILRLANERDQINVVNDQVGTPTYTGDLADAVLNIIPGSDRLSGPEIYHYSNEGVASWYDFAVEIISLIGKQCTVVPIPTTEYPLPAARPFYSVLSKSKIREEFGLSIPHWKESLKKCIENLSSNTI